MLLHAERIPPGTVISCELCIVGTGPAGLTVASWFTRNPGRKRRGTGPTVVVLEGNPDAAPDLSGRRAWGHRRGIGALYYRPTTASQHRYGGSVAGWLAEARPDYLRSSRLRSFGGTSVVWSGWWLPLEEADFGRAFGKDGTPWPLSAGELRPYYHAVHKGLRLGPFAYDQPDDLSSLAGLPGECRLPVGGALRTRVIVIKRIDFGARMRTAIDRSPDIALYFGANATGLRTADSTGGRCIETIEAASADSDGAIRPFQVQARNVVLAAGALENTRLLMLSSLGNDHDQLGRHFREHPYLWTAARIDIGSRWRETHPLYFGDLPVPVGEDAGAVAALVGDSATSERLGIGSFRAVLGGNKDVPGTISLCWEQSCGRASRVVLASNLPPDDLGLPRLRVEPDVTDTDRLTGQQALTQITTALAEIGIRPVQLPPLTDDPWSWRMPGQVTAGNHPMGVTRMAARPADGVADPNCRVFGTTNLYLTGSGLFPRGGHANPTLTIVALAARLGEHLRDAP